MTHEITVAEFQHAENLIIKQIQDRSYKSEIWELQGGHKQSNIGIRLRKLDPFIDEDDVLTLFFLAF